MPLIRVPIDMFHEVEKRMKYRFGDKERERSNHAVQIASRGVRMPSCSHQRIAWSGPPHDFVQAITCLDCGGHATEPEMKDAGFNFNNCPDWIFNAIMDGKAELKFKKGNPSVFRMGKR